MTSLVDGLPSDSLPVADRGLQYGDGVFETIAVSAGRPLLWDAHWRRLHAGLTSLGLPPPAEELLRDEAGRLLQERQSGVLKILVTAGAGGRGYRRPDSPRCHRILSLHPLPPYPQTHWRDGVRVRLCRTRLALQPQLAGLKHCNRLEQVLARAEWDDDAVAEGLVLDAAGRLAEGTMSNVFAVHGNILRTPSLTECGVRGVMRDAVLELATRAGYGTEEVDAPLADWLDAEELFLTNSVIGLWPVRQVDARSYAVGDVSRDLQQRLAHAGLTVMPQGEH